LSKEYFLAVSVKSGCDLKEYLVSQEWLDVKNTHGEPRLAWEENTSVSQEEKILKVLANSGLGA